LIEPPASGQIAWPGSLMDDKPQSSCARRDGEPILSALDLARRLEAGDVTAPAVIDLCAEAISRREPEIGAFTALDIETARGAAAATRLAHSPLRGLPFGVKDIFDTAELPTQYGSPIYAGYRPKADAAAVALLRRAGGLVLGKTVTTELASLQPAKTRNPRNPAHTPGGSSSGSAAAVAAGMVPIALGSQTAGSVIRPAAFCGIAGFKPSFRLLPTVGMKCFAWSLDTAGLFAARVADVAFAAAAITGRDLRVDRLDPAAPTIAVVRTLRWAEASPDMQAALEQAARAAEAAGARIRELQLPPALEAAMAAQFTIQDHEAYRALAYEFDHHRDQLAPLLREQLARAAAIDTDSYDEARRVARRARRIFADLMADTDAILTPSAPGAAPHGLGATGDPVFNRLWTLLGPPCINVPGIIDAHGLPLGVQIIGRFGRDRTALEAALFLERALSVGQRYV
jgi:Asp-tRNA(Asn)/Glu-tRNA(Gln) amidotransferase A subunit family amidase